MKYNFDKTFSRYGTDCIKWDRQGAGSLPFGIADMDFETLPEMRQALIERIQNGTFGYTFEGNAFYASVQKWFSERHSLSLEKEDILAVAGTLESLSLILDGFFAPGDKIILCTPIYHPFRTTLERFGIDTVVVPLQNEDGKYGFDFEGIEEAFINGAKGFILCNPHNPVGRAWRCEDIERITDLCLKYDALLLADEIHCDFVFEEAGVMHISALTVHPRASECTIVMTAASKSFNIAGAKCSLIFVKNPVLKEKLAFEIKKYHNEVNLFGLLATQTAYTYGNEWLNELKKYLWDNTRYVISYCGEKLPSVTVTVPEATYLMWLDFSAYKLPQEEIMRLLSEEAHITAGSGLVCGEAGRGFVRLNVGTQRKMLEQGLQAIASVFSRFEQ